MVIGIDASRANITERTGVEQYGYHVIRELARLDRKNDYRLYTREPLTKDLQGLPGNFQSVVVPGRRLWTYWALSRELRKNPVDALFVPSHTVPPVHPKRTVVTVHDIGFKRFRKNYGFYHYLSLALGTKLSVRWAGTVVTPSRAVALEVGKEYDVPANKMQVVPNGFDPSPYRKLTARDVAAVMKKYRTKDPYLVFVGRLEARKNVVALVEAFYRLRDSGLFGGQLVLVGNPGVGYEDIRRMIGKRPSPEYVVHTGYVHDTERFALLKGARALVFPSLHEGFGIPILEAFAADTPVVTAGRGATKEVAGGAAVLVDPESVASIHQGMERVLVDEALVGKLTAAGRERTKQFGWNKTAREILKALTA
ncbi:MAG TPA: glycosyltransferase family 1 protein [Patescibacteria group bacterium]|jgi:glycosyltransferase involved in cell wall biosynthesis